MACNKWGSRAFDSLWDAATFEQRQLIATSLRERVDALRSNQFGRFIYDRCGLRCFTERPSDWTQLKTQRRELIDSPASDHVCHLTARPNFVLCPHNHALKVKTTTTTGDIRELSSYRLNNVSWLAVQPVRHLSPRVGHGTVSKWVCVYVSKLEMYEAPGWML